LSIDCVGAAAALHLTIALLHLRLVMLLLLLLLQILHAAADITCGCRHHMLPTAL